MRRSIVMSFTLVTLYITNFRSSYSLIIVNVIPHLSARVCARARVHQCDICMCDVTMILMPHNNANNIVFLMCVCVCVCVQLDIALTNYSLVTIYITDDLTW